MKMPPDKWEKVKSLFEAALEHDPDSWLSFLAKACPEEDIRLEAERLLACEAARGGFLSNSGIETRSCTQTSSQCPRCAAGDILAARFRIVQFLARGGMGEVYEAEDLELHDHIALKMVRPELALLDAHALLRFKREIQLAKQVTHPNVCRIFDLFRHQQPASHSQPMLADLIFVSMELLRGETLSQRLRRAGRMSIEEALPLVTQMLSALEAAHEAQILHRDLKPSNVFLVPSRVPGKLRAVITDFGLALGTNAEFGPLAGHATTDGVIGTPTYMSPEQIAGRELTPASDIYALGLVLYEMVTGARPFEEETPMLSALRRLNDDAPSLRSVVRELNPVWEILILWCLQRDPKD